jgi:hypothetical protein
VVKPFGGALLLTTRRRNSVYVSCKVGNFVEERNNYTIQAMTKIELIKKLEELKVHPLYYSLDGELKPDSINVVPRNSEWEVFYLSERGSIHDSRLFSTQEQAFDFVAKRFEEQDRVLRNAGLKK